MGADSVTDKLTTVSLEQVENIAETLLKSERTASANEVVLLHYLVSTLRENEQRQELVYRMGLALRDLDERVTKGDAAFEVLKNSHEHLQAHVSNESARIDLIGATVNAMFDKLSAVAQQAEEEGKRLTALADSLPEP